MGLYVCGDIHPNTYLTDPLGYTRDSAHLSSEDSRHCQHRRSLPYCTLPRILTYLHLSNRIPPRILISNFLHQHALLNRNLYQCNLPGNILLPILVGFYPHILFRPWTLNSNFLLNRDLYQCNLPGSILLHLLRIVVGILLRPWIVISTFRRQCSLLSCTLPRGNASCQCLVQE